MNTIQRAYKFRLYPTTEQAEQLARTFGCARFVYNHFLRVRMDGFFKDKERIGFNETCKRLTVLKQQPETVWLCEVSNVVLQQSLRNLDTAFANFFQKRAKYPSFKSKHGPQSARYTTSGFRIKAGELWLAKMSAPLDMRWSRKIKGEVSSVTVSKDAAGRYFASLLSTEEVETLPVVSKEIGIDLGLKDALITSDGWAHPNPRSSSSHRSDWRGRNARSAARRRAPRTARKHGSRWPASMRRSPTVAATGRTSSPRN